MMMRKALQRFWFALFPSRCTTVEYVDEWLVCVRCGRHIGAHQYVRNETGGASAIVSARPKVVDRVVVDQGYVSTKPI